MHASRYLTIVSKIKLFQLKCHNGKRLMCYNKTTVIEPPDESASIPKYTPRKNENITELKARLLYQSRKRGMLENGLLLSTFAAMHLSNMNVPDLKIYDKLINEPTNDWDLYYWAAGIKETPTEFQSHIMDKLKQHVQNASRVSRIQQPDLY